MSRPPGSLHSFLQPARYYLCSRLISGSPGPWLATPSVSGPGCDSSWAGQNLTRGITSNRGLSLQMHLFRNQNAVAAIIVGLALLSLACVGFAPEARGPISAEEFVRAMVAHRAPLIDLYLGNHLNPNARARQDRPLLLAAVLQQDSGIVQRLLAAGAC